MNNLDLRPLSVGEVLDRTFTLYRNYFVLFLGISAIPHILVLLVNLSQLAFLIPSGMPMPGTRRPPIPASIGSPGALGAYFGLMFLAVIVAFVALLLSQGATVIAVSELYLGRTITIQESFKTVLGELGTLVGVLILNGLAIIAGFILFIFPGFYVMCRLLVSVPAALLERLNARVAMERSWELTRDNAGRAFLIILLYFALSFAAAGLLTFPFQILIVLQKNSPEMVLVYLGLTQVGAFIGNVLVTPVMTIASSILYYDLRVRKEAFDLQLMLAPLAGPVTGGVPKTII
ncbi:MAG TPA: glycerophosphoryl diester phosphodiesterase membrane domain-containing protein [Candidatus Acidoferrales bacterium]|nr:glycerophosphoryl diester phosphodiesterase membrane domain-containing protein [Candidatus Acidoferrales bacterium]